MISNSYATSYPSTSSVFVSSSMGRPLRIEPTHWDLDEFRQDMLDRWRLIYEGVDQKTIDTVLGDPHERYRPGWVRPPLDETWQEVKTDLTRRMLDNQVKMRICGSQRERTLVMYLDRRLTLMEWYLEFRGRLAAPVCVKPLNHGGAHEDKQGNEWPDRG